MRNGLNRRWLPCDKNVTVIASILTPATRNDPPAAWVAYSFFSGLDEMPYFFSFR
jgi:hypothetical protein